MSPIIMGHLALASTVYHGNLTTWSATWDVISILLYATFEFSTTVLSFTQNWECVSSTWIFISVLFGLCIFLRPDLVDEGDYSIPLNITLFILLGATTLLEFVGQAANKKVTIFWIIFGVSCAIPAIVLWMLSSPNGPCEGINLVGHGVWHILIGMAMLSLYLSKFKQVYSTDYI